MFVCLRQWKSYHSKLQEPKHISLHDDHSHTQVQLALASTVLREALAIEPNKESLEVGETVIRLRKR